MTVKLIVVGEGATKVELVASDEGTNAMPTMKVSFQAEVSNYEGGDRYAPNKTYYIAREEAMLWITRGVVHDAVPTHLTPDAVAENERNLLPGKALTLGEVLKALAVARAPGA